MYYCFKNECCTGSRACYVFKNSKDALEFVGSDSKRVWTHWFNCGDWNIVKRKFYVPKYVFAFIK